jgi:large subunit ribosomal protein L5
MKSSKDILLEAVVKTGQELKIKNRNAYPKIDKIVVHIGIGKDRGNNQVIENIQRDLQKITGQKPAFRKAKKSIATFKVRIGEPVGLIVTLRGKKMADFLSKLINVTLPAIRDFRGVPTTAFDKQGNYSLGIREHTVFPEISFTQGGQPHGLQVTISTTSKNPDETRALLTNLGFPFSKK